MIQCSALQSWVMCMLAPAMLNQGRGVPISSHSRHGLPWAFGDFDSEVLHRTTKNFPSQIFFVSLTPLLFFICGRNCCGFTFACKEAWKLLSFCKWGSQSLRTSSLILITMPWAILIHSNDCIDLNAVLDSFIDDICVFNIIVPGTLPITHFDPFFSCVTFTGGVNQYCCLTNLKVWSLYWRISEDWHEGGTRLHVLLFAFL